MKSKVRRNLSIFFALAIVSLFSNCKKSPKNIESIVSNTPTKQITNNENSQQIKYEIRYPNQPELEEIVESTKSIKRVKGNKYIDTKPLLSNQEYYLLFCLKNPIKKDYFENILFAPKTKPGKGELITIYPVDLKDHKFRIELKYPKQDSQEPIQPTEQYDKETLERFKKLTEEIRQNNPNQLQDNQVIAIGYEINPTTGSTKYFLSKPITVKEK